MLETFSLFSSLSSSAGDSGTIEAFGVLTIRLRPRFAVPGDGVFSSTANRTALLTRLLVDFCIALCKAFFRSGLTLLIGSNGDADTSVNAAFFVVLRRAFFFSDVEISGVLTTCGI